jgi:hypothetical protein
MPLVLISYLLAVVFACLAPAHPGAEFLLVTASLVFLLVGACFHVLHNWTRELDRQDTDAAFDLRTERNVQRLMDEQNDRLAKFNLFEEEA